MKNSTEKYLTERVKNIQVSAIKQMPLLARKFSDTVSLGQGIPSFSTPKYIREGVIELLKKDSKIGKYSLQPGMPVLRRAITDNIQKEKGCKVDSETELFITAGAMEALAVGVSTIIEKEDEVILFDPGYSSHIEQVLFAGGKPVFVPLNEEKAWALDIALLKEAISSKTKAIVVCSPSNPTGKVFSENELKDICQLAVKNDLFIIGDQTYDFLVYNSKPFISLLDYPSVRERLILCSSFSKRFAMTGWRVGYMVAPSFIIEQALKVHDAFLICAPTISQYAALIGLTKKLESEQNFKSILSQRRELICKRLEALDDLFFYHKPEGAYYVFAGYKKTDLNSRDFAVKVLEETGVITIPGRAFGPQGEGHVRMSFAGEEKDIEQAFDRLEQWNKKL